MTPAQPQSQPYAHELGLMKQLLSRHNPKSFYSKKAIEAYLAKHFTYVNPDGTPETPSTGMVDWSEKEAAAARVISHLPRYAQILLIETGCDLRLYPNTEKVGVAYKVDNADIENTKNEYSDKPPAGFYSPKNHSIHWTMGDDYYTQIFLHEIGHAIDCDEEQQFYADDPQFNFGPYIQQYLARERVAPSDLYTHIKVGDLACHFKNGEYTDDALSTETVAELFAERTMLHWQYRREPPLVDMVMEGKYPKIWPTMRDQYLPFLEQKAETLYAKNHHLPSNIGGNPWRVVEDAVLSGRLTLAAVHR